MAIYRLSASNISRGKGKSAVAAAAYRAADKIIDQRQGFTFDYSNKNDLAHSEIITPANAPSWARNREELWNRVEAAEKRKDARLAKEIQIALPVELNTKQQIELVRDFVTQNCTSLGVAADINIHAKQGNPHAHIMLTTRNIGENGLDLKKNLELDRKSALMQWRKSWEEISNYHLARAGHDIRIDHRSYADLGIDLEPQHKIGVIYNRIGRDAMERLKDHQRIARENGERIIANPQIALDFITRRQAVFTENDICRLAHRQSADALQYQQVRDAVLNDKSLVRLGPDQKNNESYTTTQVLEAEKQMIAMATDLAKSPRHPVADHIIAQAKVTRTLTPEQDKALDHIMTAADLCAVIGYAGAGKSYTLGAVREAYEASGYRVIGAALAGIAAQGLQRESGIESRTIARLMFDIEKEQEKLTPKDILIIDEAGMVSTRQMHRLVEYVHHAGAKMVMVGSAEQLQPIEAGGPFRALYNRIGAVEITEIRRQQQDWQKQATKQLESNQTDKALETYHEKGRIHAHQTKDQAIEAMVKQWSQAQAQGSVVALAYRNADVETLNRSIRAEANRLGRLRGKEREFETIKGKRMLSAGDRIIFLKNDARMGVMNGSFGVIERIRRSVIQVRLDNDTRIAFDLKDYNHIDHGYAATIHKLQGATIDRSVILADQYCDKHAALVALSRHRHDLSMHYSKESFENFETLKSTLSRQRLKQLAVDFESKDHGQTIDDRSGKLDDRKIAPPDLPGDRRDIRTSCGNDRTPGHRDDSPDRRHPQNIGKRPDRDAESVFSLENESARDCSRMGIGGKQSFTSDQGGNSRYAGVGAEMVVDVVCNRGAYYNSSRDRILGLALRSEVLRNEKSSAELEQLHKSLQKTAVERSEDNRSDCFSKIRPDQKQELERFKREINLVEYAQTNGYELSSKSSRYSKVLTHNNGDKIVVATDKDGHGIYFNVYDKNDNGSIIDFVQRRKALNLGETRQELRSWINEPRDLPQKQSKPEPSTKELQFVVCEFVDSREINRSDYLEKDRCISASILLDRRFKGRIYQDQRNNIIFPHYDAHGSLTGYEMKNRDFTGFSRGGIKGLWESTNIDSAQRIVICESAVDALSHAQLTKSGSQTAYLSIGGALSKRQEIQLEDKLHRARNMGVEIVIATDNDKAGHELAGTLRQIAPEAKRTIPGNDKKDWNELLQSQQRSLRREIQRDSKIVT
jgi:Ti-type conjugative transfer relaxase TraA